VLSGNWEKRNNQAAGSKYHLWGWVDKKGGPELDSQIKGSQKGAVGEKPGKCVVWGNGEERGNLHA